MNQREFTAYVISKILKRFPQFEQCCCMKENGVTDIEYSSKEGNLELWITTQDTEITIGISGLKRALMDWHMHITTFDYDFLNDDVDNAIVVIENILSDKSDIVDSSRIGFTLNDFEHVKEHQAADEVINVTCWSNL